PNFHRAASFSLANSDLDSRTGSRTTTTARACPGSRRLRALRKVRVQEQLTRDWCTAGEGHGAGRALEQLPPGRDEMQLGVQVLCPPVQLEEGEALGLC